MGGRRLVRATGIALVCVAVLLGALVGYRLWGTSLVERRGQRALAEDFERRPAGAPVDLGDSVALIELPSIGVRKFVVEGVGVGELKAGPGHYPGTPLPGERGNAAIAGHRTTYGAPFGDLDALQAGDPVFVTTAAGRFRYEVTEQLVVDPDAGGWVLDATGDDRLTLTTCNPKYSAEERLIVVARLVTD